MKPRKYVMQQLCANEGQYRIIVYAYSGETSYVRNLLSAWGYKNSDMEEYKNWWRMEFIKQ